MSTCTGHDAATEWNKWRELIKRANARLSMPCEYAVTCGLWTSVLQWPQSSVCMFRFPKVSPLTTSLAVCDRCMAHCRRRHHGRGLDLHLPLSCHVPKAAVIVLCWNLHRICLCIYAPFCLVLLLTVKVHREANFVNKLMN